MPNLRGASSGAEIQPTPSEGRVNESLDFGSIVNAASGVVEAVGQMRGRQRAKVEANEAVKYLDSVITEAEGSVNFQPDATAIDRANSLINSLESEIGGPLTNQEKQNFRQLAQESERLASAGEVDPSAITRFDLMRAKMLRNTIARNPAAAREFRSLIYGDNNFLSRLVEPTAEEDAQAAFAAEMRQRLQSELLTSMVDEFPEITYMDPDEAYSYLQRKGALEAHSQAAMAQTDYQRLEAEQRAGKIIETAQWERTANEQMAYVVPTTVKRYKQALNLTNADDAVRAIDAAYAEIAAQATAMYSPHLGSQWVQDKLKPLNDLRQLYRDMVVPGKEVERKADQVSIAQSGAALKAYRINPSFADAQVLSEWVAVLGPAAQRKFADTVMNSAPMADLLGNIGIQVVGGRYRPTSIPDRTVQELQVEGDSANTIFRTTAPAFPTLSAQSKAGYTKWLVNEFEDALDAPGTDKLTPLVMAIGDPSASDVLQDPAFEGYREPIRRGLNRLTETLNTTVASLAGTAGKATGFARDKDGVILLVGTDPILGRANAVIKSIIQGRAHLNGTTYEEESEAFWIEQAPRTP